jgi:hypothetical protein
MYRTGTFSDPDEVADAGYSGMLEGSMTVIPGVLNKITSAMNVLSPDSVLAGNLHRLMKPASSQKGRQHTKHKASGDARREINQSTGNTNGDYAGHKGHEHEDSGKIPSDSREF